MTELTIAATATMADLRAQLEQLEKEALSTYTQAGMSFFETLVSENDVRSSTRETSDWHGFTVSIPDVIVDGKKFTFSIVATDVEQTEASKLLSKAVRDAQKQAERQDVERDKLRAKLLALGVNVEI